MGLGHPDIVFCSMINPDQEPSWQCGASPANGRLLALETFKVTGNRDRVEILDVFSATPGLCNVFLSNWTFEVCMSMPAIPWAQITRYSGTFDPDSQMEILEAAANLVSCALGFPKWNGVARGIPTVLPRLRRLHLETPEFTHRLNTPLLEKLIFHYWSGTMYEVGEILPFVQRSSCTLKKLVIRGCNVDFSLITVLHGLPSLTHLVIENDNLNSTPAQIALLDALADGLCLNLASMAFRVGLNDVRRFFAMARSRFQLEPPSARLAFLGAGEPPSSLARHTSWSKSKRCATKALTFPLSTPMKRKL